MLFILQSMDEVRLVERLYCDYKSLLFRIAFQILNDHALAEDAVHQSFIKVINNLHKIDETNTAKTRNFLAIICRNTAISMYNKRKKLSENVDFDLEQDCADAKYNPENIVIDNESAYKIEQTVGCLPDIYLDVLTLKIVHHCSREEIARLLDIQPNNVKKRLAVARGKVAHALEKEELV